MLLLLSYLNLLPDPVLNSADNGLPPILSEVPQNENTRASDSTSKLLNDGEMETNDESSGSGNSLNKNNGHIIEANLEDNMELNHDEYSAQDEVQVAIVDDSISKVNLPNVTVYGKPGI